jgi:hypothetical protein
MTILVTGNFMSKSFNKPELMLVRNHDWRQMKADADETYRCYELFRWSAQPV